MHLYIQFKLLRFSTGFTSNIIKNYFPFLVCFSSFMYLRTYTKSLNSWDNFTLTL